MKKMKDLFDRIHENKGPWGGLSRGVFCISKVRRTNSNRRNSKIKEIITWSVNDYLGLANYLKSKS